MQLREHNVTSPNGEDTEVKLKRFHPGPYRKGGEQITVVLERQVIYQLTQLLESVAVESQSYWRVRDAVTLCDAVLQSAKEHGY